LKISREVKTAILVLSGIALFIYLLSFLMGENLFDNSNTYYTEFEYNALSSASPVTIKGNKIGKIEEVKYDFDTGKTRVEFTVNPKLKFSKNSKIRLYETGIMGGNALAIIDAEDGEFAKSGDFIASEVKPGLVNSLEKDFSKVSADLDTTIRSADTLVNNLNALVVDESDAGLKQTITELNSTLKSFKNLSYSVQGVIKQNDNKIAAILDNFNVTSENLSKLSDDLKDIEIAKTIAKFDESLSSINALMTSLNSNDGTLGKLLNDEALYNNLEAASKEMEELLLDIKLHPARYRRILSKKEIPYKEPTEDQKN
jgi:phospholipid/cholesterol/gamma-HCH transport system substrate-binding protein